jgi:hypothetical protein
MKRGGAGWQRSLSSPNAPQLAGGFFTAHVFGGGPTPGKSEIQKIELPLNWDKLVAKYQDFEPNYVRY